MFNHSQRHLAKRAGPLFNPDSRLRTAAREAMRQAHLVDQVVAKKHDLELALSIARQ